MTTYWCGWCGETAQGNGREERIQCMRCVREFIGLFGFWAEAAMSPLDDGVEPGVPMAARKRFTFFGADGRVLGMTQSPRPSPSPAAWDRSG